MEHMKQELSVHDLMTIIGDKEAALTLTRTQFNYAMHLVELQKVKIAELEQQYAAIVAATQD